MIFSNERTKHVHAVLEITRIFRLICFVRTEQNQTDYNLNTGRSRSASVFQIAVLALTAYMTRSFHVVYQTQFSE